MIEITRETVEVHRCIRKYPWLMEMVKSKLFHKFCDIHITKQRCYFCCDCMSAPLCTLCFQKNDHKDHTTIQTFRSSKQSCVRKDDISKYMELSGIQLYSINGKQIVNIHQRPRDENHRHRSNVSRKYCKTCKRELLDAASSASYCSIECKFRSVLGSELESLEETTTPEQKSEVSEENGEPEKKEPEKKKQCRRKGKPQRSGFYGFNLQIDLHSTS